MENVPPPFKRASTAFTSASVTKKASSLLLQSAFKHTASVKRSLASLKDREQIEERTAHPQINLSLSDGTGCNLRQTGEAGGCF